MKALLLAGYEQGKDQTPAREPCARRSRITASCSWASAGAWTPIQASERGARLGTQVAMLTLHYREGAEAGRVTLQVLPDMMGELKAVCDKVLG